MVLTFQTGQNGSTKKNGNRQLLHKERSCTLLQTNKISSSLRILRGIFLSYNSETNWNSQTLFVDILYYKKYAVESSGFSIFHAIFDNCAFLCFSEEDFLKRLKFGKSLIFLSDSDGHQSITILDDFLFSLHYDVHFEDKKIERFEWVDLIVASCCLWLLVVTRRSRFVARLSVACSSSELETGVSGENMGREPCLSREYGAGRRSPRKYGAGGRKPRARFF